MRNHLAPCTLLLALAWHCPHALATPSPLPLTMTVECTYQRDCFYQGGGIPLRLTVTNVSNHRVSVPVAYMERSGIYIKLTNLANKQVGSVRPGVPDTGLRKQLTTLEPNQSFSLLSTIRGSDLDQLNAMPLGVRAEVEVFETVGEPEMGQVTRAVARKSFIILDRR